MKSFFVKLAVTVVIFVLIFNSISVEQFLYQIGKANGLYLLFALIFMYLSTLLASYRWYLMMKTLRYRERFNFFYRSYFKGTFFNQALPSTIGGDTIRVLDLIANRHNKKRAVFDVLSDRFIGLMGLLILAIALNLWMPELFEKRLFSLIVGIGFLGVAGITVLIYSSRIKLLKRFKVTRFFYDFSMRFRVILRNKKRFLTQLTLSLGVHVFTILSFYAIALSIHLKVDPMIFIVIIPTVLIITIIPVSLAGWGIRESAMIGFFLLIGANETKVLSVSVLYGLLSVLIGIYGSYYYIRDEEQKKIDRYEHVLEA